MMLYIYVKFHQNIWNGFQLTERIHLHSRNDYFQYLLCSKGRNYKSRLTRVTVSVFCMLSHGALHLWEVSSKYRSGTVFNLLNVHEYIVEMAMFNAQRAIIPKVGKPEVLFMVPAHHLVVLYILVKFGETISEWWKHWKMDTQNFRRNNIIPSQLFLSPHNKLGLSSTTNFVRHFMG